MATLFTAEFAWLWAIVLMVALFWPVRQLIWVLQVRRAEQRDGSVDETRRAALKRRAGVSSALLCFVFSVLYANNLFQGQ